MPKVKLTSPILERLKAPDKGQIEYFDAGYPGLALRVGSTGARTWCYFGRLHGKVKRVSLGKLQDLGLADARRKASTVAEALRNGDDPTAAKRLKRERLERETVEAVALEWLHRDQGGNRTVGEARRVMERDIIPALGAGKPLVKVTRRDVADLLDGIADRGATVMARRVHSYIHRMFAWAISRGIVETNPAAGLEKPGRETARDRVLDDGELARVWRAAGTLSHPFGAIVRLLILTGARRDEIGSLRWDEVGADAIRLEGSRTKNGQAHTIPLAAEARAIIDSLPKVENPDTGKAEFVFSTTGRTPFSGWSKSKPKLDAAAAMVAADGSDIEPDPLADWRLHDIRRSVATGLQRQGERLEVIEAVLNHVSGSRAGVVGVYQRHGFDEEKRAALDAWARHVLGLIEGNRGADVVPIRQGGAA